MATVGSFSKSSVGEFFGALAGESWQEKVINFPPDVFGVAASVLARTGAYLAVVSHWPPKNLKKPRWEDHVSTIAKKWRAEWQFGGSKPPAYVQKLWHAITEDAAISLSELFKINYSKVADPRQHKARRLTRNLLEILAISDETCSGVGIPSNKGKFSTALEEWAGFKLWAQLIYASPATLCDNIDPIHFSVLPKLHTPQTGITVRSLSHNLALCHASEVRIRWGWGSSPNVEDRRHGLNILLLPWPDTIRPADFSSCTPRWGDLPGMKETGHGFFCYDVRGGRPWDARRFEEILERASSHVGTIDAVVMPELAVRQREVDKIARHLLSIRPRPPILITGVSVPHGGGTIRNISVTLVPFQKSKGRGKFEYVRFDQAKHHRWRLDSRQISQYGLGGVLDPSCFWWENSYVPRRDLIFIAINPWLTLCTLLCEDLARPDPIADIVRAVGPNLIVSLLMDGPQLAKRWPARYGTVLADDPGSSVLTITNLAMAELSRARGQPSSRVIALWKDAQCGEPIEISLPSGKEAIVICATRERCLEYAADGRSDNQAAARLNLSGVHAV